MTNVCGMVFLVQNWNMGTGNFCLFDFIPKIVTVQNVYESMIIEPVQSACNSLHGQGFQNIRTKNKNFVLYFFLPKIVT
jgi:hypothetical protein